MGLFDWLFRNPKPSGDPQGFFKLLNGYTPVFTSFGGSIYESELCRAAIHAKAVHASKLSVEIVGAADPFLTNRLKKAPNALQTWGQFLYRLCTILEVQTTAFIVPIFDEFGRKTGIYPVLPSSCEVKQYGGEPYLVYKFSDGKTAAVELSECGVLTKFQYENDLFGAGNKALMPTMELINIQNQGIQEGVKSSATFRFAATLSNFSSAEDLSKMRKEFVASNFGKDSGTFILFPNTFRDIRQLTPQQFTADAAQMESIRKNVFDYFGVNEDILQNKAYGNTWGAFYEGAVEPFAIQVSDVLTKQLFTYTERSYGAGIMLTSNRLQYMTPEEKMKVSEGMADRGIMNRDEIREIWNLPPLPDGQGKAYTIRGEYYLLTDDNEKTKENENAE